MDSLTDSCLFGKVDGNGNTAFSVFPVVRFNLPVHQLDERTRHVETDTDSQFVQFTVVLDLVECIEYFCFFLIGNSYTVICYCDYYIGIFFDGCDANRTLGVFQSVTQHVTDDFGESFLVCDYAHVFRYGRSVNNHFFLSGG